jgi:chorismate dehydratase
VLRLTAQASLSLPVSAPTPRPLRVGSPAYLVARPLDLGLEREPGIELERAVPARLVEGLRAGRLDVALVSSIELFRAPGYRWIDGPAVCGAGPVRSVQVFLRKPLEEVERVLLDPDSRAAAVLTRVVLPPRLRSAPRFLEIEPGRGPERAALEEDADAWLAIGDAALRRALSSPAPQSFDPCAAWFADTGLPFAFAVWIVRPGVEPAPEALAAFARARERGRAALEDLADRAAAEWALPVEACRRYLGLECRYDPGPALARALFAFRDAAAAIGQCDAALDPSPISLPACPV